jgi:hypothetical protein
MHWLLLLKGSADPVSVELLCLIKLDAGLPTLSLSLSDMALVTQAGERGRQRDWH